MPVMLERGELAEPELIPDSWEDGLDYQRCWTLEQRAEVIERTNQEYLQQFQPEPIETYGNTRFTRQTNR
jgi:hypothetical protein